MNDLETAVFDYRKALEREHLAWEAQHHAGNAFKAACDDTTALRQALNTLVGKHPSLVKLEDVTAIVHHGDYKEARVDFFDKEGKHING